MRCGNFLKDCPDVTAEGVSLARFNQHFIAWLKHADRSLKVNDKLSP